MHHGATSRRKRRRLLSLLAAFVGAGCSAILGLPEGIDYGPDATLATEASPPEAAAPALEAEAPAPVPAARDRRCDGLVHSCGAQSTDDCCASSVVEGGDFKR